MKIKDILTINLDHDIKNVINIEEITENEIQKEIEDYIVTDGLARDFQQFVDKYTSNAIETGVWISGFYGSGKSYFGKMIGYLLSNQLISGTPSRERLLQRFIGIEDEMFFKSKVSKLDQRKNLVVFLDIAKQDTSRGLSYTLFKNFLKTVDLPQDEYGYMLFSSMIAEGKTDISKYIAAHIKQDWNGLKGNRRKYFTACKELHITTGLTENEFDQLLLSTQKAIETYSPADLARDIKSFVDLAPDTNVVFMFDETSEAVNQKKIDLLDLEGVSEALNTLGGRVWTVAIAQEKLDDVISNAGLNKAQLIKVTDRFVEKIHLEATEVDTIIKNRILKKNEQGLALLDENFQKNSGKIGDHSNLQGYGLSNTGTGDSYAAYYPFYENQFSLLQNFLFGTKGYTSTKVAARGMIITTFDIIRKMVREDDLFKTVTGWQIAVEANNQPHIRLVSRFNAAEKILEGHAINGRKLLETINFLDEAEVVQATLLNISKSFFADADDVFQRQAEVKEALELLVDAKILIVNSNVYKITSDVEQKILDEMNGYAVQQYLKKNRLVDIYKKSTLISGLGSVSDGVKYFFNVRTDDQDDMANPGAKEMSFMVKSLYTMNENRVGEINELKQQYDSQKNIAILYPDNSKFKEIDRLIDDIIRIEFISDKYPNKSTEEGKVAMDLIRTKDDKENTLKIEVDRALTNSTLIYLFNTAILSDSNFTAEVQKQQRKMMENVYSKRLKQQLPETTAPQIIKQQSPSHLHALLSGDEFRFFDHQGNFIGNALSVVEEINSVIRNTYVSGSDLEAKLSKAPTGYQYGTIITTLAAMLRAGKLAVKNPSLKDPVYSVKDPGALDIFSKANEFKKSSFKANTQSLSTAQKQQIVEFILEGDLNDALQKKENYKVDYNTNDYQLTNAIRDIARIYVDKIQGFADNATDFKTYFPNASQLQDQIRNYTSVVTPENYITRASDFLNTKADFDSAIVQVNKMEKFLKTNLVKLQEWQKYVQDVSGDLVKANALDAGIKDKNEEFQNLLKTDITKSFPQLQQLAQEIKDRYHSKFKTALDANASRFRQLADKAAQLILDIDALPNKLNDAARAEAANIQNFAAQRAVNELVLNFSIFNDKSGFSYSEFITSASTIDQNSAKLDFLKASLKTLPKPVPKPDNDDDDDPVPPPAPKTFSRTLPGSTLSVAEYKKWLEQETMNMANADDADEVTISL